MLSTQKIKLSATALFVMIAVSVSVYGKNVSAPPVFWNVFNAEVKKTKVTLRWTVTEYNNKIFYIQHSTNGSEWTTIDSVKSKNSPLTLDDYDYTHINKLDGRHYYRVKQVDIDMKNSGYSEVIAVVLKNDASDDSKTAEVSLTPNPATDHVRIVSENGSQHNFTKAAIYDLMGKLIAEKNIEAYSNVVNIKDLPAGIYLMRAQGDNGSFFSQKIIKQ